MININDLHFEMESSGRLLSFRCLDIPESEAKYSFYVKRNGQVIHKTPYLSAPSFQYPMDEEGFYQMVFFLRQGDNLSYKESEFIPFFSHTAILSGPAELTAIAAERGVSEGEEASFAFLDCLGIAERWLDAVFAHGDADANQVKLMRAELETILQGFPDVPVFWFRWSLWPMREPLRRLHWTLEELYDVCRRSERMTEELPAIVVGASGKEGGGLYAEFRQEVVERVKKAAERFRDRPSDFMRVESQLDGNKLTVKILCETRLPADVYAYYLLRDGEIIDRVANGPNPQHSWTLKEDGLYFVQGFIRHGSHMALAHSSPIYFGDDSAFRDFMNDRAYAMPGELASFPDIDMSVSSAPFCNILIVFLNDVSEKHPQKRRAGLEEVARLDFASAHAAIYSNGRPATLNAGNLLLSGIANLNGRYCYGADDLASGTAGEDLNGKTGEYSCLYWTTERLSLYTDYLGFGRWFYYQT